MEKDVIKDSDRKVFDVIIDNQPVGIYQREEKHSGRNNTVESWWAFFHDEWIPYDCGMRRICWEFSFKESCTSKYKWDEWRFSKTGSGHIKANGVEVYSFFARDYDFAFAHASNAMKVLPEKSFNFFDQKSEVNRKITYWGAPSLIARLEKCELSVKPDLDLITPEDWIRTINAISFKVKGFMYGNGSTDYLCHGCIAFDDSMINWFPNSNEE